MYSLRLGRLIFFLFKLGVGEGGEGGQEVLIIKLSVHQQSRFQIKRDLANKKFDTVNVAKQTFRCYKRLRKHSAGKLLCVIKMQWACSRNYQ